MTRRKRIAGHFVFMDHPEMGRYASDANCFQLSETAPEYRRAPLLGEHTEYVMRELLGMPEERVPRAVGRWRVPVDYSSLRSNDEDTW